MYSALEIEKSLTDRLLSLHRKASKYDDPHVSVKLQISDDKILHLGYKN
jgi:hypothetical protein